MKDFLHKILLGEPALLLGVVTSLLLLFGIEQETATEWATTLAPLITGLLTRFFVKPAPPEEIGL